MPEVWAGVRSPTQTLAFFFAFGMRTFERLRPSGFGVKLLHSERTKRTFGPAKSGKGFVGPILLLFQITSLFASSVQPPSCDEPWLRLLRPSWQFLSAVRGLKP